MLLRRDVTMQVCNEVQQLTRSNVRKFGFVPEKILDKEIRKESHNEACSFTKRLPSRGLHKLRLLQMK